MLSPKRTKFRKAQKGRRRMGGKSSRKLEVSFGEYGLKVVETGWITDRQIESIRKVITKFLKKGGKMWLRIFPDKPVSTKSAEVPMGGGKGTVDHWVAPVRAGTVIFELTGITEEEAKEAFRLAGFKLSLKTKFVKK